MAGRKRRRIAPGYIACAQCDRDLPDGTGLDADGSLIPSAFRLRRRNGKYTPVSYCFACERIRGRATWERLRTDPVFQEKKRVYERARQAEAKAPHRQKRIRETTMLGDDVRALVERGWSRRAIQEATGVSRGSLRRWEHATGLVLESTVARLHSRLLALRGLPVQGARRRC